MNTSYKRARDALLVTYRAHAELVPYTEDASLFVRGDVAKFVISTDVPWEVATAFGLQLAQNGVLTLPFPRVYYELSYNFCEPNLTSIAYFVRQLDSDSSAWRTVVYTANSLYGEGVSTIVETRFSGGRVEHPATNVCNVGLDDLEVSRTIGSEVIALTALLSFKRADIKTVTPSDKVQRARAKLGKEPLPEYHVVSLKLGEHVARGEYKGGSHASPVPHWRRGHVRQLNGRAIAVSPCVVNGEPLRFPTYRAT